MYMHNWLSCPVKNYSRTVPTVDTWEVIIKPANDVRPTLTVAVEEQPPAPNVLQGPSPPVQELLAAAHVPLVQLDITGQLQGQDARFVPPTPSLATHAQQLPIALHVKQGPHQCPVRLDVAPAKLDSTGRKPGLDAGNVPPTFTLVEEQNLALLVLLENILLLDLLHQVLVTTVTYFLVYEVFTCHA